MTRPKLKDGEGKTELVRLRVTPAERQLIRRRAKKAKAKTEADWIRQRLVGDD